MGNSNQNVVVDTTLKNEVVNLVREKINKNEMFTAYDITLQMRKKDKSVKHYEVKSVVHSLFEQCKFPSYYVRRLIDVGAKVPPFLYYDMYCDPSLYNPQTRNDSGSTTSSVSSKNDVVDKCVKSKPKSNNRVFVPVECVRAINAKPGDNLFAFPDPIGKQLLLKRSNGNFGGHLSNHSHSYSVDKYGNTKVSKIALEKAGISNVNNCKVSHDSKLRAIVIK